MVQTVRHPGNNIFPIKGFLFQNKAVYLHILFARINTQKKHNMKRTITKMFGLAAALLLPLMTQAQSVDYRCSFENDSDTIGWTRVNSSTANKWYINSAVAATGSNSMYISADYGATNTYDVSSSSVSYAYQSFWFDSGEYYISYDWRCYGESSYDYIRVFLAPSDATFQADILPNGSTSSSGFTTTVPAGWICLNGTRQLNGTSSWQNFTTTFSVSQSDTFHLVFLWASDPSAGSQPAGGIDNIRMAEILCHNTMIPTISNVTDSSFFLSWVDTSDAYQWYVEIDSAGQSQGTGMMIVTSDTSYLFTDLTPNTTYHLHLATDCNGDTSIWMHLTVKTNCTGLTLLPLTENFEAYNSGGVNNTSFIDCWGHVNNYSSYTFGYPYITNSTTASHNGGSKGLYWYSYGDAGPYKGVILPAVDNTIYPIDTLQVSFWAKSTSASYRPVFVVGVIPNANDISTFVPVQTVTITSGTEWTHVTVPFTSYTGPQGRIAVLAPVSSSTWYAYTDEFVVEPVPACPSIDDVTVETVGSGSAFLSWTAIGSDNVIASYTVSYDTLGATSFDNTETVTSSTIMLTGLEANTDYKVRVQATCNNDSTGMWAETTFHTRTLPCLVADTTGTDTVSLYTGTSTATGVFINSSWGNTFSEAIYTAAELTAAGLSAGNITGIRLGYSATSSYNKELTIYMANTSLSSLTSTASMVNPSTMTRVLNPVVRPSGSPSGWVYYTFDTPFVWDGTSNIIMATFYNQSGSSQSSTGHYSYCTSTGRTGSAIYKYKDSNPFTLSDCMSTGNSGSASSYVPSISWIKFACAVESPCAAPMVRLTRVELDTVSLVWGPGHEETSWNIYYQADGDSAWTVISNVTDMYYDFTGLQPMTHYTVHVAPECGGDSLFSVVEFTTPCVPVTTLPFTEDFENFTASSTYGSPITNCWNRIGTYTYSGYPYISTSYAHSGIRSLYFYGGGSYIASLVLPYIDFPADSLQISFAAYKTSANYNIMVGVMTDPNDFATFVPVDTISPVDINSWEMFEVPLNAYTGNGHHIALACAGASTSYMYIDDITVEYIPTCPRPRDIVVHNINTNTADVRWNANGTSYIVEYGPYGFNHGDGTEITVLDDSTTLYGLLHSTRYQVYIKSVCGSGDTSSWSFATNFNSACGIIDTLPFREEFTDWGIGTSARPNCWSMGGYSSYPYILNLSTRDSVYRALNMYTYGANQVYASMLPLDSIQLPISNVQVVFTAVGNSSSSYSRTLVVGVCSQQGNMSTFSPVDTVRLSDIVNTYEVSFDTVTTGAKYVTFVSLTERGLYGNYAYLIDVQLEAIPPCQTPNQVRVTNLTAISADIQWNSRSGASLWQIEYGPRGFALGTGTRATIASNPYTLTGLNPSSTYDVYLRSICGVGDTSSWMRSPLRFNTLQQPASVPYFYDFENGDEWNNWQTNSNIDVNWYRDTAAGSGAQDGSGRFSIYISADTGATISTNTGAVVNAVAYRDFDFGNDPNHSYQISFRAYAGGTPPTSSGSVYDGLMLLHVNPNTPVEANSNPIHSPWGSVDTLSRFFLIHGSSYWNTYSTLIDTITGVHRFALYWFNQNISGFIGTPAAVDNFSIISFDCPRPAGVRAENVSVTSTDLTWVGPDPATFNVTIRNQGGASFSLDTIVHTNRIHVTGLSPANRYTVYVRRVCSDEESSASSVLYTFMTLICNDATLVTLETPNAVTSNYLPISTGTNYCYSQQLVMASEIAGGGEISAISFRYSGTAAMNEHTNCTISMGHTNKTAFSTDFVNPDSMTVVYVGSVRSEEGWGRIILHTPFVYNGADNLVIGIEDNSGRHSTSSYYQNFAVDQLMSPMSVCYYSDTNITVTRTGLINFTGRRHTYNERNQMLIEVCPSNPCTPPSLRTPLVRSNNVTLRWQNTAERYAVSYRPETTSSWAADQIIVTENRYTITNVTPHTNYVYRVRQYCDTTGVSNWAYGYFDSDNIPCLPPEDLRVNSVTNRRVSLAWTPAENNVSYHVHVFNTAFDQIDTCYLSRCMVNGLEAGVTYYAAVRAECNGFDEPGEYSDTIQFTTPICPDASDLHVVEVYGNSAVLDWTPGGSETSWEILYGNYGFRQEEGISVMANEHPFTLIDLWGSTEYEAYIRTHCGSNFPGEHWIGPVSFTTLYSAINSASDDSRVHLQPNPTRGDVTLSLPEGSSEVRVDVLDVTGRSCMNLTFTDGAERHIIPTAKLPSGTYFLVITTSDINTVKKLIVH